MIHQNIIYYIGSKNKRIDKNPTIIDTPQMIRRPGIALSYACDYTDLTILKKLANALPSSPAKLWDTVHQMMKAKRRCTSHAIGWQTLKHKNAKRRLPNAHIQYK
jgi:hypothetical protein